MKTKAKTTDTLKEKVEKILADGNYEDAWEYDNTVKKLLSLIDEEKGEAYKKGYWERDKDDKEEKEMQEADEAHRTEEGWCCACGYDMAVLEEKIKKSQDSFRRKVEEELLKDEKIIQIRKPTHGNCCTCQDCGQYHDDCRCGEIGTRNELRAEQRKKLKTLQP